MFRNQYGGRGQGRGAGMGNGLGRGQGRGRGAGLGRGRGGGFGNGQGRGFWGANQQASDWEPGLGWNQPLSALSAGVPAAEKKSWLERFKAHLTRRMSEVDEELSNY